MNLPAGHGHRGPDAARLVQQMCGSVIAHDIVTADRIHFGDGLVTHFGLTRDDLPIWTMIPAAAGGRIGDFNLPCRLSSS